MLGFVWVVLHFSGSVCAVLLETFPDDFVAAFAGSSGAGGALLESAVGAGMAIVDGSGSGGSEEEFAGAGAADGGGGGGGGGRVAHPGPASVRSAVALDDLKCIVDGVAEAIAKSGTGAGAGTCGRLVIIDSLTAYMALHSVSAAVRAIRRLSERADVDQVVAVIHSDVHDMDTLASLNHMASSTIAVRETGAGGRFPGEATITHRRRSGKVLAETVLYGVDRESVLRTSLVATGSDAAGDDGSASADPTANLSFNLNLTASQRQAKANVKLPYVTLRAVPHTNPNVPADLHHPCARAPPPRPPPPQIRRAQERARE